jgi:hypothetical protein
MFKTTRKDGRSYRSIAADALKDEEPGSTFTYKKIADAIGLHPRDDLRRIQAAVRSANKPLLKLYNRYAETVPGMGYRIAPAREHIRVAAGFEKKASRQINRSIAVLHNTNLSEMTESERMLHQNQYMIAQAIAASHNYNKRRFDRIEELIKSKV